MKDRIKQIRKQFGLNQTEFAERLGVAQSSIVRWESGEMVPVSRRIAISQMFGVSAKWLDDGSGDMFATEPPPPPPEPARDFVARAFEALPEDVQTLLLEVLDRYIERQAKPTKVANVSHVGGDVSIKQ